MTQHSSLYDRIGGAATVERLVDAHLFVLRSQPENAQLCCFYTRGFDHYRTRMCEYITGFLGGPTLYMQHHGFPQLREQHQKLAITTQLRDLWYSCMTQAIAQEIADPELRAELNAVFWSVADSLCNA